MMYALSSYHTCLHMKCSGDEARAGDEANTHTHVRTSLCTAGADSWIEWCPSCLSTKLHSRYHTTSTVGGNISYLPHFNFHLILAFCLATDMIIIVVFIVCYVTFSILSSLVLSTLISRAQCVTAGGPTQDKCIHRTTLIEFIISLQLQH